MRQGSASSPLNIELQGDAELHHHRIFANGLIDRCGASLAILDIVRSLIRIVDAETNTTLTKLHLAHRFEASEVVRLQWFATRFCSLLFRNLSLLIVEVFDQETASTPGSDADDEFAAYSPHPPTQSIHVAPHVLIEGKWRDYNDLAPRPEASSHAGQMVALDGTGLWVLCVIKCPHPVGEKKRTSIPAGAGQAQRRYAAEKRCVCESSWVRDASRVAASAGTALDEWRVVGSGASSSFVGLLRSSRSAEHCSFAVTRVILHGSVGKALSVIPFAASQINFLVLRKVPKTPSSGAAAGLRTGRRPPITVLSSFDSDGGPAAPEQEPSLVLNDFGENDPDEARFSPLNAIVGGSGPPVAALAPLLLTAGSSHELEALAITSSLQSKDACVALDITAPESFEVGGSVAMLFSSPLSARMDTDSAASFTVGLSPSAHAEQGPKLFAGTASLQGVHLVPVVPPTSEVAVPGNNFLLLGLSEMPSRGGAVSSTLVYSGIPERDGAEDAPPATLSQNGGGGSSSKASNFVKCCVPVVRIQSFSVQRWEVTSSPVQQQQQDSPVSDCDGIQGAPQPAAPTADALAALERTVGKRLAEMELRLLTAMRESEERTVARILAALGGVQSS